MELKNKHYDYMVVGAGIFGATFANIMTSKGYKVIVVDKRPNVGGNVYDYNEDGILVHKYGAHIFHTNNKEVYDYITQFAEFNNYTHRVIASSCGRVYSLPFNMYTFSQIFGDKALTPDNVRKIIANEIERYGVEGPILNLEDKAISMVGKTVYRILVKEYTEKQWDRPCSELPPSIINRLPLRFEYDDRYFSDKYQGMPIGGYTKMIEKMLEGCEVLLSTNFVRNKELLMDMADKIIYTGPIDELLNYEFGTLEYRGLSFATKVYNTDNKQGTSVINYCDCTKPYTRSIEFKFMYPENEEARNLNKTVVTYETPNEWKRGDECYYPINDTKNNATYEKLLEAAKVKYPNFIFGGRLGAYKYYNIDQCIEEAMKLANEQDKKIS